LKEVVAPLEMGKNDDIGLVALEKIKFMLNFF
jgi:hypothetical protein